MDCSSPDFSERVHGILQARILKWAAVPFSRGSSWPRDRTQVSPTAGRFFFFFFQADSLLSEPPGKPSVSRREGQEKITKFPLMKEGQRPGNKAALYLFRLFPSACSHSAPFLGWNKLPDSEPCQLVTPPNLTCWECSSALTQKQKQEQHPKDTPLQPLPSVLLLLTWTSGKSATPKFHSQCGPGKAT